MHRRIEMMSSCRAVNKRLVGVAEEKGLKTGRRSRLSALEIPEDKQTEEDWTRLRSSRKAWRGQIQTEDVLSRLKSRPNVGLTKPSYSWAVENTWFTWAAHRVGQVVDHTHQLYFYKVNRRRRTEGVSVYVVCVRNVSSAFQPRPHHLYTYNISCDLRLFHRSHCSYINPTFIFFMF